ncbi:MAG: hypothetical protein MHM6MM_004974 [Cercozoa sp. M6MM]
MARQETDIEVANRVLASAEPENADMARLRDVVAGFTETIEFDRDVNLEFLCQLALLKIACGPAQCFKDATQEEQRQIRNLLTHWEVDRNSTLPNLETARKLLRFASATRHNPSWDGKVLQGYRRFIDALQHATSVMTAQHISRTERLEFLLQVIRKATALNTKVAREVIDAWKTEANWASENDVEISDIRHLCEFAEWACSEVNAAQALRRAIEAVTLCFCRQCGMGASSVAMNASLTVLRDRITRAANNGKIPLKDLQWVNLAPTAANRSALLTHGRLLGRFAFFFRDETSRRRAAQIFRDNWPLIPNAADWENEVRITLQDETADTARRIVCLAIQ